MYTNLVLSGGGVRGLAFVGCIEVLESQPYFPFFRNFIGASVGSIFALFLTCGYSSSEIVEFINTHVMDSKYTQLNFKNIMNFYTTCGLDDGTNLMEIIKLILTNKGCEPDITFMQLGKKMGRNLIVTGSNLTNHSIEYFNIDNSPDMPVHVAIRISTCVPLIFTPVVYNDSYYVDACIYNNFPIEYFKRESTTTCGILLKDDIVEKRNDNQHIRPFANIVDFFGELVYGIISHVENLQIDSSLFKYKKQLYVIQVEQLSIVRWKDMRLNIDSSIFNLLYEKGKTQMTNQLQSLRFNDSSSR